MKKLACTVVAAALALCFALSACGAKYVTNYSASRIVTTNTAEEATVSFDSYSGTYVMKLNSSGGDVFISYTAILGEGNINVYYDYNGEKLDLLKIGAKGSTAGKTDAFSSDNTIYIIIESDGDCSGGIFSFFLKKAG